MPKFTLIITLIVFKIQLVFASFHFIEYYEQIFSNISFSKDEKKRFYSSVASELERFLQSPDEEIKSPKGPAWEDKKIIVMMSKSVLAHINQERPN